MNMNSASSSISSLNTSMQPSISFGFTFFTNLYVLEKCSSSSLGTTLQKNVSKETGSSSFTGSNGGKQKCPREAIAETSSFVQGSKEKSLGWSICLLIVRLVYNRAINHWDVYFAPKVFQDPFNLRGRNHNWLAIGKSCRFATNSHSLILILKVNILTLELALNRWKPGNALLNRRSYNIPNWFRKIKCVYRKAFVLQPTVDKNPQILQKKISRRGWWYNWLASI